jgi:hypothetical protein
MGQCGSEAGHLEQLDLEEQELGDEEPEGDEDPGPADQEEEGVPPPEYSALAGGDNVMEDDGPRLDEDEDEEDGPESEPSVAVEPPASPPAPLDTPASQVPGPSDAVIPRADGSDAV